jgi:hypothetical protein
MKIDRNIHEILSSKGLEINNKLRQFLNTIEGREDLYDGHSTLSYTMQERMGGKKKSSHISIKWDHVNGLINAFTIKILGDILKEDIEWSNNFFGKRVMKKVTKIQSYEILCCPFITRKEESSNFDYKYPILNEKIEIDFDELINKVNSLNFTELDTNTLSKIRIFLNEIINECKQTVTDINESLNTEIFSIDKDKNGKVDILDSSDLMKLLKKNQTSIIDIDKEYVHKFIRVSNYLKQRENNIQSIFNAILNENSISDKKELIGILKNQIHNYELVLFHSLNMVVSLCSGNLIEFYEIYESFDKLNIFNSNWENEVSEKLINIGDKLNDLMFSIYSMELSIVNELKHLSYVTSESFHMLNDSVSYQLGEIESSINTNNLLTGIQAYQTYKINKNTKTFR